MKIKIDRFVLAIVIVTGIAYLFPFWGSKNSPIPIDIISTVGVSLIFFFYGLKLNLEKLKASLKNWRLHLLIQSSTFILFPVIALVAYPFIETPQSHTIWLAFLFLAALPSTVSSSVVMVSMAKGNVPAAIFNASISGLIGIAVTPLWMGLFLKQATSDYHLSTIYFKLIVEILIPVILGMALQHYWGNFAVKNSRYLTLFDKSVILLIIYKSFAEAFIGNVFSTVGLTELLLIGLVVAALFYMVYFINGYLSKQLRFSLEDQITAQFCGTKKSLVHGTVFSKILFPSSIPVGIILLPLMVFHAFQILIISIIATGLSKRNEVGN
jgi:solute carrier family 10 (sodium/bile acid cotransporter), member 7